MWPAQDNFFVANFCEFVKTILKKEYSLTSSLLFKKQLANKNKNKIIFFVYGMKRCLRFLNFHDLNIAKFG
jgi:hypothetical protein